MPRPIVTLLTDFGTRDWFVGVVHGVILSRAPEAQIVDLTHDIPPGDVSLAAFVLEVATPEFPPGAVHVAVVDPGVGTGRRALCVAARGHYFVGPDNGILECALAAPGAQAFEIREERFLRLPLSRTFHARDVFAPVAAHLARGEQPPVLGPPVADALRLEPRRAVSLDGELRGAVAYIDRFGNCITNLGEEDLRHAFPGVPPEELAVGIAAQWVQGISSTYAGVPVGTLVAVIGSTGRLEVASYAAQAAARLGVAVGDPVSVRRRPGGTSGSRADMVWR
jgi:S-adenosylmethionine hydrolase